MKPIKIIIADDHQFLIDGIKSSLSDCSDIDIIGDANNGLEVINLLKTLKPHIILLDINMPEMDGIETTEILKKDFKDIKIIILSQYNDRVFVQRLHKSGVDAYLLKDCGKDELIKTIKHVYKGGLYFNVSQKDTDNKFPLNLENLDSLVSKRELEILKLLTKDYTTAQIAKELGVEPPTVKTYEYRLKRKSGTNTIPGLVAWAYQNKII